MLPEELAPKAGDGVFRSLLRARPGLEPFLRRLCESINRREAMQGTIALGKSRGRAEDFEPLVEVLGGGALSLSIRGEMRLSLDAFFAGIPPARREVWLDDLFHAVGLSRAALPLRKQEAAARLETLLERFRVSFPDLDPIHRNLQSKHPRWCRAAQITRFLRGNSEAMTLADLGARLCGDSKALKSGGLLRQVREWLDLLEDAPGKDGGPGEAATLSWESLAGVERVVIEGEGPVLSCENESPFHRLKRDGFTGVLLYSQGFPNAAVLRLWDLLGQSAPEREFLHWGDSDLAGLRIASILHRVHPLRLHRCNLPELRRHGDFLIPLDEQERTRIDGFRAAHPDFPFIAELEFTGRQGWLEQENWRATQGDGNGNHAVERRGGDAATS